MQALLLVAHGSRRAQSNEEVAILADKIKDRCADQYEVVNAAFLELADPSIPEGIKQCADQGATSIVVLPYFLNSGRHVTEDIPEIVNSAKPDYPDVDVQIASHLGASDQMVELLINVSKTASGS